MKTCNKCGNEVKDEAKFCGKCGNKFDVQAQVQTNTDGVTCSKCGNIVAVGKKFCGKCGNKLEEKNDVSIISGHIQWNIIPGQVALKITEQDIDSYGKVKGINIQDGVKALFFVEGKFIAELESGSYSFKEFGVGAKSVLTKLFDFFKGVNKEKSGVFNNNALPITIILVRDVDFPLVYEFKNKRIGNLSKDVALHILVKITNINEFYKNHLLDKKFVSFNTMSELLASSVSRVLDEKLPTFETEDFYAQSEILKTEFNKAISYTYQYLTVSKIISFSTSSEALRQIEQLNEELYVAELELEQLTNRNHFLNKLNDEKNQQELREAQSQADFRAAMDKIDQQNLLTEDEKDKFALMLQAQQIIRGAQTQEEVDVAIGQIRKTELLREEEISVLENQITHRAELQNLSDTQQIQLATIQNQKILDKEKLDWELQIGNVRFENQLNREKLQAETELEIKRKKQESKLEIMRELQNMRQERENAEHQRVFDLKKMELDAYSNMSVEQIMAINPNISPEAAKALAEKFKGEHLQSQVEMANQQKDEMRSFMEQQMALMREMVAGNKESSQAHEEKYVDVMKTTVQAVAGMPNVKPTICRCGKCGAENPAGVGFCEKCGAGM